MNSTTLKAKLKATKVISESNAIRIHRSISWLKCAETQEKDPDICFVSLWISFNACYASDPGKAISINEWEKFKSFIIKLVNHDNENRIYNLLWEKFSGPVRLLIENQFLYNPFWEFQRKENSDWERTFRKSISDAQTLLGKKDVAPLLLIVLDRLYTLRNQVIHGGATYKSKLNRKQVKDGVRMLNSLLPVILDILILNPEDDWGNIYYPAIQ